MFSAWQFILRSFAYYWRMNLAVGSGVIAATAVLTGALLVGDSVRGSLRQLTLERLGKVDELLLTDRFFREKLVEELAEISYFTESFASAQGAILLPAATVERRGEQVARSGQVFVIGSEPEFWDLATTGRRPAEHPGDDEIILNEPLAVELGVKVGDIVALRLPDSSQIPADSTLGRKTERVRSLPRLRVIDILPAEGLGRFGLRPNQGLPRNAYVSLSMLQDVLEEPGRLNAILVSGKLREPTERQHERLQELLQPKLVDFGLRLERITEHFPTRESDDDESSNGEVVFDYFTLTTDRMVLEPAVQRAAEAAWKPYEAQPVLTYLADSIRKEATRDSEDEDPNGSESELELEIPYSTITAIDSSSSLLLLPPGERLAEGEIILNSWAAVQLEAVVGDRIVVEYFEPETIHGEHVLASAEFTLRGIVPLIEPSRPYRRNRRAVFDEIPTPFNDPNLTPEVRGITDQDSIEDWDAPFPFDISRMRPEDDEYWKNHRTTPKAFVSLADGQRLWGSRFGQATSFRVPVTSELRLAELEHNLLAQLRLPETMEMLGFEFTPIKLEGLKSAAGTTPFDGLFLALSFFIILAAVLLVALMFRLGVEGRAAQVGILQAVGLPASRTMAFLVREGAVVAAVAGLFGVAAGTLYALLMLAGLQNWWVGAIVSPFLQFHMTVRSLAIGYASGTLVSVLAIFLSVRKLQQVGPCRLLAGQASLDTPRTTRQSRVWWLAGCTLLILAGGLGVFAMRLTGEAQAGAFVGGGTLVLVGLLILAWNALRGSSRWGRVQSLWQLAASSAARNPTRSALTIGLVSAATFLIVSMSAFRLTPTLEGAGGFSLQARSSLPIFVNLNRESVREELMGNRAEALEGTPIFSFRVKLGDDASCRNLYRSTRPQVFGVTREFTEYYDEPREDAFRWSATAAKDADDVANPWRLLWNSSDEDVIPVVLDQNTALYSLHWYGGVGSQHSVTYDDGQTLKFEIVGLVTNSVLQGALLISEEHFRNRFPQLSGYQFFFVGAQSDRQAEVREALEVTFGDEGLDVTSTERVLEDLLAVQNTYLSTFQSLGALGLLLGTFGVATVQIRNVLERRGELALLRAQGFRSARIGQLVLLENLSLLLGGLLTGIIAALSAVLPHIILGGAQVPLASSLQMLAAVFLIGLISGMIAVRICLRQAVIPALRGE
jgi:putative ABC transport system permease protein